MNIRTATILALTGAALGCVTAPPPGPPADLRSVAQEREYRPVLYGRDGKPVEAGDATAAGEPGAALATRDLAGNQGGRMYILELYQSVIEERDHLALEVGALGSEIERARAALSAADQRIAELEQALEGAAAENQRQRAENIDLAGRLATAQIRRLQAEKILLEQRLADMGGADQGAPASKP